MRYMNGGRFRRPPTWELRAILAVALIALIVGSVSSSHAVRTTPLGPAFTARVVSVADGDTLHVVNNGNVITVRLRRVDCPEKAQKLGPEAKTATASWLQRFSTVTVTPYDIDIYGRSVAEVTSPDGESLEEALVTGGLAWWYQEFDPIDASLSSLQAQAKAAHRGVWVDANPMPPWEFRKLQKAGFRFRHSLVVPKAPIQISPLLGAPVH